MFQLRRRGPVAYEDLLREMEAIEQHLLGVDPSAAMTLMALEAKIRERFHQLDVMAGGKPAQEDFSMSDDLTLDEIRAMIPQDLPAFPSMEEIGLRRARRRMVETIGVAAGLAIATALGVFGLASVLQFALTWLA